VRSRCTANATNDQTGRTQDGLWEGNAVVPGRHKIIDNVQAKHYYCHQKGTFPGYCGKEVSAMLLDEQFDADEILRDVDEQYADEESLDEEEMRELNFGNMHDEHANFNDMTSDLDNAEDLWE
jgi:hypothetical protein